MFRRLVPLSLPVLLIASAGLAQTQWNNPAGGVWGDAANWDPMDVPDTLGEDAEIGLAGTYAVTIQSGSYTIGALSVLNPDAAIDVLGGRTLQLGGNLFSNGLLTLNSNNSSASAALDFLTNATLDGTGEVVLQQIGVRSLVTSSTGSTLTHGADHTIRGRGRIDAELVNLGLISADVSGGTLELASATVVNNGALAAPGGVMRLVSTQIDQTGGGLMLADGGRFDVNSGDVSGVEGGSIESVSGGSLQVTSGGELTLRNVRLEGVSNVLGNGDILVEGSSLEHNGLLTLNSNNSSASAALDFLTNATLDGTGEVVLQQIGVRSLVTSTTNATLTHGADHTIRGRGRIDAPMVNNGVVAADLASNVMQVTGAPKSNAGLMVAAGGFLELFDTAVSQTPDGLILADAGVVRIPASATVAIGGGAIESRNGGTFELVSGATLTLDGVDGDADIDLLGGAELEIRPAGATNHGLITVNTNSSSSAALLRFSADATLGGDGEVRLRQIGARSQIVAEPGVTGVLGEGQRITGRGVLGGRLELEGVIAPGLDAIDNITLSGSLAMLAPARFECEVRSGASDTIVGAGDFEAAGTLEAIIADANYNPAFGDEFPVVQAGGGVSGRFDAVTGPALPGVLMWRARIEPTRAVLVVSCLADFNIDGVINTQDVLAFLNAWTSGDPDADINDDGEINTLDVLTFLNLWNNGC